MVSRSLTGKEEIKQLRLTSMGLGNYGCLDVILARALPYWRPGRRSRRRIRASGHGRPARGRRGRAGSARWLVVVAGGRSARSYTPGCPQEAPQAPADGSDPAEEAEW